LTEAKLLSIDLVPQPFLIPIDSSVWNWVGGNDNHGTGAWRNKYSLQSSYITGAGYTFDSNFTLFIALVVTGFPSATYVVRTNTDNNVQKHGSDNSDADYHHFHSNGNSPQTGQGAPYQTTAVYENVPGHSPPKAYLWWVDYVPGASGEPMNLGMCYITVTYSLSGGEHTIIEKVYNGNKDLIATYTSYPISGQSGTKNYYFVHQNSDNSVMEKAALLPTENLQQFIDM
jgi:hypothetical protein